MPDWKPGALIVLLAVVAFEAPAQRSMIEPKSAIGEEAVAPAGERPASKDLVVDGKAVGKRLAALPNEICWVCNRVLEQSGVAYLVQGQRVPVHLGKCDETLRARARQSLARLKPRGAFLGAGGEMIGLSNVWFFAGLYVLLGLVFAALCAHGAFHSGHSPSLWFGAGMIFNALAFLVLLTRPKRRVVALAGVPAGLHKIAATYEPQPCPKCGAGNHPSALQCGGCGANLRPRITSEVQRAGLRTV